MVVAVRGLDVGDVAVCGVEDRTEGADLESVLDRIGVGCVVTSGVDAMSCQRVVGHTERHVKEVSLV